MKKNLNLNWQTQGVTPTLISGDDALMIYNSLPEQVGVGLRYDKPSQTVIGSTPIAVVNLNAFAQKYGARTPNLRDLSRLEIMRIAKGKHYIDSRNLVVRSIEDSYWPQNNSLLKTIYELAEEKEGSIRHPFMIEGFSFVPNSKDKTGYGLTLVAGPDFKIVQDERFDGKHNGESFSEVDELGIPNFDKKGSRTWYAKNKGLSGLCLYGGLVLGSYGSDLANSNGYGRVVFLK